MTDRLTGFSVRFFDKCPDSFYEPILGEMLDAGVNAIELNFPEDHERILGGTLLKLALRFEYRAVHSQELISLDKSPVEVARCQEIMQAVDAHALTVHPNAMPSYGWLDGTFGGRARIENMNIGKFGAWPNEVARAIEQVPKAEIVADVQHTESLGGKKTVRKAVRDLHNLGARIAHYHLSGLGPELEHVGLDKVPEAQLDALFSYLEDPDAPLIFETRGRVRRPDGSIFYDLTEWPVDLERAKPYIGELATIR